MLREDAQINAQGRSRNSVKNNNKRGRASLNSFQGQPLVVNLPQQLEPSAERITETLLFRRCYRVISYHPPQDCNIQATALSAQLSAKVLQQLT